RGSFRPEKGGGAQIVLANLLLSDTPNPGEPSLDNFRSPSAINAEARALQSRRATPTPPRVRLMVGRLEIEGLSLAQGAFGSQTAAGLISKLESAAGRSIFGFPLSLLVARPFTAAKASALEISLGLEGGAALFADKMESSFSSDSLALAAQGLSVAWPERRAAQRRVAQEPQASGGTYLFGGGGGYLTSFKDLLAQASLNPLRSDFSLEAVFDPAENSLTVIMPRMEIAGGLAYLSLLLEFSNLTPAALLSLSSLSPASLSLAADRTALYETGLTRLAMDFRDAGLVPLLISAEGRMLNLTGREASSRLSDALEMILAIRLDPALANLGSLSKEMRTFLLDPVFLAVRARPDPPLSLENLSLLTQSGGLGLFEVGPTLSLSVSVNSRPPVAVEFRPQGAFDVDYTGEDSLLHPRP
ncbi:MAG: hypothetical protein LBE49_06215, partial [Deltaproteobacteria bacterium]|nr:hypothetical protein [Deltaproteobacteria bacterium]